MTGGYRDENVSLNAAIAELTQEVLAKRSELHALLNSSTYREIVERERVFKHRRMAQRAREERRRGRWPWVVMILVLGIVAPVAAPFMAALF